MPWGRSSLIPPRTTLTISDELPPWQEGPIDLRSWFGAKREQPLELEIGSGKGTFLVRHAAELRDVNFIGVEYARAYWRHAADRCRRHGLSNVRLVHTEAEMFVRHYVPDGLLHRVHVYFPDPWPKTRHHKRRLIKGPFLRLLHQKIEPEASVRIVTDHDGYHDWILAAIAHVADLFETVPWRHAEGDEDDELVGTNYERKFRRRSKRCHALEVRRR